MRSCKKRLVKQIRIINTLLTGFNNDLVNSEMTSLEKTYGEFTDSYAQECGTVGEEEDEGTTKEVLKEISVLSEAIDNLYLECMKGFVHGQWSKRKRLTYWRSPPDQDLHTHNYQNDHQSGHLEAVLRVHPTH